MLEAILLVVANLWLGPGEPRPPVECQRPGVTAVIEKGEGDRDVVRECPSPKRGGN